MSKSRSFLLKSTLVCVGAAAVAAPSPAASRGLHTIVPNADPARLRRIIEDEGRRLGTRGIEFGMWIGNREVLATALGESMTTVPATTNMHYRIGGTAETFMSTLLLMLAEQGRIELDAPISRWFPKLLDADKVTVRMLVGNTAGYLDYVKQEAFIKAATSEPFRSFTDDELIQYSVGGRKMNFTPGTTQQYSHTDNVILGQVIQRATGQSIQDLFEKNIAVPLDLKNTRYPSDQEIDGPVLHAFTSDRGVYEDCTHWNASWGSTPGNVNSTLHDLGRWGPAFGTGRLISPAHFKEQIAPTSVGKGANRADLYFAYGFGVSNGWLLQTPNINGYSGAFGYNLATGVTIVVEATKGEASTSDAPGIAILRKVASYVTPATPVTR